MEDVLDVYAQEPNPEIPRICFDESPCQLIGEVMAPIPMKPGQALKEDNEYERNGTAVLLLAYNIDTGERIVQVRKQRTKADYAEFMQEMADKHYPNVKKIQLIQDNLNTHKAGSFYENLSPQEARKLAQKLEFHFTPKHGSWLNMAEIEFSAIRRQCLDRRIATMEELEAEVAAWEKERNEKNVKIHWSFTIEEARTKMSKHYHAFANKN